ncbi:LysR family transcriptional regulator [Streptomyces sp. NPDC002795]|uniref:LysR family transcriptional regulator n=1 Tax=Streptomyces sp. NPDC002795 TaxID=3364665 RepID=UPI0036B7361C
MNTSLKADDIDLRLVHYVTVLAEELHFGRAAARLHIAQQTLSAQVGRLEQRLGVTLFARDRRHVELTGAGELFVTRGRQLLDLAAVLVREVSEPARPVRVDVVTEGLSSGLAAQYLRAHLPDVPLEVVQGHGLSRALEQLRRGEVDLAFGRVSGLPAAKEHAFRRMLVKLERVGVVLPEHHVLAHDDRVALSGLRGYPILLHTAVEAVDWEDWNTSLVSHFDLTVGRRLHGHGRAAANAAALAYDMPTLAPLNAPVPEGLVVRPLHAPIPLCPLWLVWSAPEGALHDTRRTTHIAAVIEDIDRLAADQSWRAFPREPWWLPDPDRAELPTAGTR